MEQLGEAPALVVDGETLTLRQVLTDASLAGRLEWVRQAIDAELIRQEAEARGLEASCEELQSAADRFREERGLHTSAQTYAWLAEKGLSRADWSQFLEQEVLEQKLHHLIAGAQVEAHFAQHPLAYQRVELSQILVAEEDVARELFLQISDEDAEFHTLARRYSQDEATRKLGGYLGEVRRGELPAAAQAAVFGNLPGSVVGPFRFRDGWRLYLVEEHHPVVLDESLRTQITDELFAAWLAERRREVPVEKPLLELVSPLP